MAGKVRCLHCREYQLKESVLKLPAGSFCNVEHAIAYGRDRSQKVQKRSLANAHKIRKAKVKEDDTRHQHKLTQTIVNRLCLLLDQGLPCISCGRSDQGGRMRNAGHFKSRGSSSGLRYDLRNLHGQCVHCNLYQSGNVEGYRQGLLTRYGSDILEYLDTSPRLRAWTGPELIQMRTEISSEIRSIESGNLPSMDWRKINVNT